MASDRVIEIGSRVKAIGQSCPAGYIGTVMAKDEDGPDSWLVKFDNWTGGHGPEHRQWFLHESCLALLPSSPEYADYVALSGRFPTESKERKSRPVASGVIDYFPDALIAVAQVSFIGNQQHNPGTPLHWDRSKSTDEADALMRHFIERGTLDSDGVRHSAKVAWRALALLQKEIEGEKKS